jgi:predicted metallopeptidase
MQWQRDDNLKSIIEALKKAYPEFNYVESDKIGCCFFSKKQSKAAAKIARVSSMHSLFMNEIYVLCVHKEYWDDASESSRLYTILHELMHIPNEGFNPESKSYRKLRDHDVQDFRHLLKTYGIDQENANEIVAKVQAVREAA